MKKRDGKIYYKGKLVMTVIKMQSETEAELLERMKKALIVVVSK